MYEHLLVYDISLQWNVNSVCFELAKFKVSKSKIN